MALWPKPTFLLEFRKHGTTFRKAGQGHHHSRATSERRRFSPPGSVDEQEACFIVRDAKGQALAYVYLEGGASPSLGGEAAHPLRGLAVRRQHHRRMQRRSRT
jgi:hypothetical protein